jgi:myo-inositol 2-dehydrogenase/D-chiro-inositol 1-dehydrogenase/scyllo-inositol 2-dehydrogenase (NAD+)
MAQQEVEKLGVAIIGAGRAGLIHARNFAAGIDGARLVAIADPVAPAREAAAKELGLERGYADYREALADRAVDAIVVVTPTALHREIVVAAAAAGKHVLCEKPMAMTEDECAAMIAACDRAGVRLQLGFMRRFARDFVEARAAVEAGAIGEVVLVKSHTRGPSVPQPWMYDIARSNGPLAEVNSHDIDTLRWFAGDDFAEVYAIGGNYRCPEARVTHPDFYDNVAMTIRFRRGAQGMIDGAQGVGYAYDARLEVVGTHGVLLVGTLQATSVVVCGGDSRLVSPAVRSWRDLFSDAYRDEDRAFVRCVREGRRPSPDGVDGLEAVRAVNAGNRSITTGLPVKLPERA